MRFMKKRSVFLMASIFVATAVQGDSASVQDNVRSESTEKASVRILIQKKKVIDHERNLVTVFNLADDTKFVIDWDQVARLTSIGVGAPLYALAHIVMAIKEISRGETARGLEQLSTMSTVVLTPWVQLYLLAKNKGHDRLTILRLLKVLPLTGVGIPFAAVGVVLHDIIKLISGLGKGQLPAGNYTKEEFKEIYGDEYKMVDA